MITIPKRYNGAKPSDWNEDQPIYQVIHKYFSSFPTYVKEGKAPCFLGKSGTGKSRASAAILNSVGYAVEPALSIGWYPASEAINRLLDYRDIREGDAYNAILDGMKNTDIIVLDDIHKLRNSPRVLEYFYMIADSRYSDLKPTIYTANFVFTEDEDPWDTVADWFTVPFSRRLKETSSGLTVIF